MTAVRTFMKVTAALGLVWTGVAHSDSIQPKFSASSAGAQVLILGVYPFTQSAAEAALRFEVIDARDYIDWNSGLAVR